jgi:uncharacterized protein YjdB
MSTLNTINMKKRTITQKSSFGLFGNLIGKLMLVVMLFAYNMGLQAQSTASFPFPQNVKYANGITVTPSASNATAIQAIFAQWKATYYEENTSTGEARIKFLQPGEDGTATVSEGIAYGMLIMLYMDNATNSTQGCFDKLWKYYQNSVDSKKLMNWKVTGWGAGKKVVDPGAATDADIDVAQALVLASKQWNDTKYKSTTDYGYTDMIKNIYSVETQNYANVTGNPRLVKPGDMFADWLNPSYFITNAFKLFASVDANDWTTLSTNMYKVLKSSANTSTGLVPDWVNPDGVTLIAQGTNLGDACSTPPPTSDAIGCSKFESYFLYDAIRVPWRMAQAYAWNADPDAKTIASNIATWAYGKYSFASNSATPFDGYRLNGTLATGLTTSGFTDKGTYHNACFTGGLGIAGMVDSKFQANLDAAFIQASIPEGANSHYFTTTTQLLYLLCMTGNMPDFTNMNPTPVRAYNVVGGCTQILVEFNKPMDGTTVTKNGWAVTMDNANTPIPITVSSAVLNADGKTVTLTLASSTVEPLIKVAYTAQTSGTIFKSADAKTVASFTGTSALNVTDVALCARPFATSAATDITGVTINIAFSKAMDPTTITAANFAVTVAGVAVTPKTVTSSTTDPTLVVITLPASSITANAQAVSVTYTAGTLAAANSGGSPKTFTITVANNYLVVTCSVIENYDPSTKLTWTTYGTSTATTTTAAPGSASNICGKFIKGTADAYMTYKGKLPKPAVPAIDSTLNNRMQTNPIFSLRVYAAKKTTFRVRLEDVYSATPWTSSIDILFTVPTASANTWYTFTQDLSSQIATSTHLNQMEIAIHPDSAITTAETVYIDDIQLCPGSPSPTVVRGYTDFTGSIVKMQFSTQMAVPTVLTDFTFSPANAVTAISIDPIDKKTLDFTLTSPYTAAQTITATYTGTTAKALNTLPLATFSAKPIINLVSRSIANGWKDDFTYKTLDYQYPNIGGGTSGATKYYTWAEDTTGIGTMTVTVKAASLAGGDYIPFGPSVKDISTQEVWDLTADPHIRFSASVPSGKTVWLRADLVDINNVNTDGVPTVQLTATGSQVVYDLNCTGLFVNKYSGLGNVDQTNIVGCNLYLWTTNGSGTPVLYTGPVTFDYLAIGTTTQISGLTPTSALFGTTTSVTAKSTALGEIYIVPANTPRIASALTDSVKKGVGVKATVSAINTATSITISTLGAGYYEVYAYNTVTGEVSRKSAPGLNIVDKTLPIITQASNGNYAAGNPITVTVNKDAQVYIVPQGTAAVLADIINASINSPQAVAKATTQIMTLPLLLTSGSKYVFYAIDYSGNISLVSTQVVTIVDVTPPIISNNTTGNVTVTTGTISAMTSKDGKLFFVKQSDIASIIDSTSLKSKAVITKAAVANTLVSFAATVALGDYVIYAIDGSGNIAGPTDIVSVVIGCVNISTLQASSPSLILKVGDPSVKLTISIATPSNATSPDNTLTTFVADASSVVDITNNLDGSCSIIGDPSVLTTTKVNITCTVTDCGGNPVTIIVPVTVNPLITCPTAISIAPLTQSIQVGAIGTLTPTITGPIGTNNINWTSGSTNYVTMNGSTNTSGSANGIAVGSSVITASITCSGVTIKATATVNVAKIPVTKIVVTPPSASVIVGNTTNLAVTVTPSNATDTTVTWSTSKSSVAKVSSSGVVSAMSVGTVTITATSNDNGAIVSSSIITVTPIDVTSITLTPSVSTTMFVKDNLSIVTRVLPLTATDSTIIWTGNNDSVATVSTSGVVTAHKAGTVIITATSSEKPSVTATLTIKVSNVDVKSIAIVGSTTMTVNGIQTLKANITPSNATDASVTWSSASSATASVDASSGLVTANASGTVTITATSVQNPTVTQTITIVVSKIMPASMSLSPGTTQNINVNDFVKLTANILPLAADQSVLWSSSSNAIATVDATGKVVGVSEGPVTITATSVSVGTLSASITVNVSLVHVKSIALSASSTTMTVGGTLPISVTLTPSNPTDQSLVWSVTNGTGSATVDQSGIVTAVTAGSVTIVATSVQDKSVSGTYIITISDILPTAMTLNYTTTQNINVNGTISLAPIFTPSNAANKKVTWSSDNAAATVDTNGVVTGISEGTANITATSKAVGTLTASVKVNVSLVHVGSITVTSSLPTMTVNGTLGMTATLTPTSPTNKSITWSVINGTGTAIVDISGVVTAKTAGTVTVVATSVQDPTVSGSFIITISNILASKIVLSPATTINLNVGNTVQVTANVTPTNAFDRTVQWSSDNKLVATVDVDGNVVAIGPGTANIIATSSTVSTVTASVPVSVTNLLITSIAVTPLTYSFIVGQVSQLSATITPTNATLKTYTWKSNDPSIVTIDANGVITAKAVGTVTITATANDAGAKVGTSTITVNPVPPVSIAASDISLLMTDAGKKISYTVSPDSTTDKSVSFKSNDQTIATVDATGLVVPAGVGSTTITITSKADGTVLTTIKVTVTSTVNVITSVTPSVPTLTLAPGVSQTILLTLNPLDASITNIDWKSSDPSATVDANGVIKAIADGSATITVTVTGPNASQTGTVTQTATISVTVASIPVSSIVLDNPILNLTLASGTTKLTATILPIDATNQGISWLSTNPSAATVNGYGDVSVVALGTTTITATTKDGTALTATSIVTVSNVPPKSITIDSTSVLLNVNDIVKLTASVLPANASQSVVWSILDPTIATIDAASGKITAQKAGSTKITATSQIDNTISQTINLQVNTVPVTKIVLDQTQLALNLLSPSVTLKAILSPSNPTNNTVKWDVNPTGVINISGGTISVLALGTTTVICTANDGSGVTATCTVTVSNIAPASIVIAPTSVTMNIGDLPNVSATVLPNGAPQSVTWSIADPSIATIDKTGMITGHLDGKTSIIATSSDGSVTSSIPLTVHKVLVATIVIDQPKVSLNVGSNVTLNVTFTPTNATDQSVTWSVLPANIVDVIKGVIHAYAVGTATVTCTANDGSGIIATCAVTVTNVPPASITLDQTPIALTVGGSQTLSATVLPTGAPSGLTWSSSDTAIATVDVSGNVVAHKAGTVTITVTSQADATIHNSVSVVVTEIPVTAINVDSPKVTLQIKTSVQVTPIFTPASPTNTNVTWLSADPSIASVSAKGVITANGVGTTTITLTSSDNTSISSPVFVTVTKIPVASISVSKTDVTVNDKGSTVSVSATILPSDANTAVVWTSNGPTFATVDNNGLIKGVATGSTTVTAASADDPTIFKTINVTITHVVTNIPVTSVSMDKPVLNLEVGQTGQLNASVIPATASNTTISYASNSAAFTVDPQTGLVTAVYAATGGLVIATSDDGGFTATCTVNVIPVALTRIEFASSSVDCSTTGTVDLSSSNLISFLPLGVATPILTWNLSDPSLGSINTNGVFTPNGASGIETVTVSSGAITASIQVNITSTAVPVATVTVSSAVSTVKFNQLVSSGVLQMNATIAPSNATEKSISWSLQKPMAGVNIDDQSGLLTFTGINGLSYNGTVTVVATSPDGGKYGSAPIQIVFNYIVQSDSIATAATTINKNATLQMVGLTTPLVKFTNMPIVWSILSSNSTGATIDPSTGLLTAGSTDGTITVVATVTDANNNNTVFTSQRIITVHTVIDVTDITVNNGVSTMKLQKGDSPIIAVSYIPANTEQTGVNLSSSDPNIVAVDASTNGKIIAQNGGTDTITITSAVNPLIKKTIIVIVDEKVSSINLSNSNATINVGDSTTITARVLSITATNQKLLYSLDKTNLAKITPGSTLDNTSTFVLKGVAAGTVIVTISANDSSNVSSTISVTIVNVPVSSVSIATSESTIEIGKSELLSATVSPNNSTFQAVQWISSDTTILKVSSTGVITGVAIGSAKITVKSVTNPSKFDTLTFTVISLILDTHTLDSLIDAGSTLYGTAHANPTKYNKTLADQLVTYIMTGSTVSGEAQGSSTLTQADIDKAAADIQLAMDKLTGKVGFNDVQASEIVLYPNPVFNELQVKGGESILSITVIDMNGQTVIITPNTTIDFSGLAAGIYNVIVKTSTSVSIQSVVKE